MQDHKRLIRELQSRAGDPSISAWDSICELLDELDQIDSASVSTCLPGLLVALTSWPDSLRLCPMEWCEAFVSGDKSPKLAIVRCLDVQQMRSLAESGRLYALIKSPSLKYLTNLDLSFYDRDSDYPDDSLDIDGFMLPAVFQLLADRDDVTLSAIHLCLEIDLEQLKVLLRSKALRHCRHLGLANAAVTPNLLIEELTRADCPLRLESLDLNWTSACGEYLSDHALKRFMESDCSQNLKSLRLLGYDLTEQGIEWIAQSPNCRGLEELEIISIEENGAGCGPIERLASSPYLQGLKRLICTQSRVSDASVKLIAETSSLSKELKHLELSGSGTDVTSDGAAALADSRFLTQLAHLNLSLNQKIGESGCLSLGKAPWMQGLDHIDLSCVAMTSTGLDAILQSIGQPTFFDVGNNRFEAGSLTLLAESQGLQLVRTLDLSGIEFDESEITAFVTSRVFSNVESLKLSFCTDQSVDQLIVELAQSSEWESLKSLDLSHTRSNWIRSGIRSVEYGITDRSLIAIANSPFLKNLTVLNLSYNGITSEGLVALSQSKLLSQLTELCLDDNQICDEGMIELARSPHLQKLQKLTLYSNNLTEQCGDAVAQSPLRDVRVLELSQQDFFHPNHPGLCCRFLREPGCDESELD